MRTDRTNSVSTSAGYRLATAEILYHLPEFPGLLQSFVWQFYDLAPDYPELRRFLDHWRRNIDGPLHSVTVGNVDLLKTRRLNHARCEFVLH